MLSHPRNVRSRTPRHIAIPRRDLTAPDDPDATDLLSSEDQASARRSRRKDARRGERGRQQRAGTPTPPPVSITIEASDGPDSSRRGRLSRNSASGTYLGDGAAHAEGSQHETASPRSGRTRRGRMARRALLLVGIVAVLGVVGWAARTGRLPVAILGSNGEMVASFALRDLQAQATGLKLDGDNASAATMPARGTTSGEATPALFLPPEATKAPKAPPPWRIRHEGHYPIKGGVLHAPSSFVPEADGSYDLIVHFHGNTWAVRESVEQANVNAIVAIINLGIGSRAYREAYEATGMWERLLEQIDRGVQNRGVPHPRLRRIALSAWSAGYGAIGSVLTFRAGDDPIDAILVEDGIHASWKEEDPTKMKPQVLRIFAAAAREAAAGNLLFSMTHSAIDPPTFAGTAAAAEYLLREVGAVPISGAVFELPPRVKLACCEHAVSARREKRLIPTSDTTVGSLHIRGFTGETKEHHAAHLLQMAATVLPELRERWSHPTEPVRRKLEL